MEKIYQFLDKIKVKVKEIDFTLVGILVAILVIVGGSTYLLIHFGKLSNSHAATDQVFIDSLLNEPDTSVMLQNAKNAGLIVESYIYDDGTYYTIKDPASGNILLTETDQQFSSADISNYQLPLLYYTTDKVATCDTAPDARVRLRNGKLDGIDHDTTITFNRPSGMDDATYTKIKTALRDAINKINNSLNQYDTAHKVPRFIDGLDNSSVSNSDMQVAVRDIGGAYGQARHRHASDVFGGTESNYLDVNPAAMLASNLGPIFTSMILTHELGHALGLDHSNTTSNLMKEGGKFTNSDANPDGTFDLNLNKDQVDALIAGHNSSGNKLPLSNCHIGPEISLFSSSQDSSSYMKGQFYLWPETYSWACGQRQGPLIADNYNTDIKWWPNSNTGIFASCGGVPWLEIKGGVIYINGLVWLPDKSPVPNDGFMISDYPFYTSFAGWTIISKATYDSFANLGYHSPAIPILPDTVLDPDAYPTGMRPMSAPSWPSDFDSQGVPPPPIPDYVKAAPNNTVMDSLSSVFYGPPTVQGISISSNSVSANGSSPYTITVNVSDPSGVDHISLVQAVINRQGDNSGLYGGYVTWSRDGNPYVGGINENACSSGGTVAINPDEKYNPLNITLDSCSVTTSGTTKTVNFKVRFNSSFTTSGVNTVSGSAENDIGSFGWQSGGTFTLIPPVDSTPPIISTWDIQPRNATSTVTATFTVTDTGGSHLQKVELVRAPYDSTNGCTDTDISGCSWSTANTLVAPTGLDSWSNSLTDNLSIVGYNPSGSFVYGLTVYDNKSNSTYEPFEIKVTVVPITSNILLFGVTSLSFTTTQGTAPARKYVSIASINGTPLNWTATADQTWCHISPSSGTDSLGGRLQASVDVMSVAGTFNCSIKFVETSGAAKTLPITYYVQAGSDTTPPTVSVTAPANNSTYITPQQVTITTSASDNIGVTKLEYYIDSILYYSGGTPLYLIYLNVDSTMNGSHVLTVKAYDAAGNVGTSANLNYTVNIPTPDTTSPTVSVSAPTGSSTVSGNSVTVSANASDNIGVVGVQFKLDGVNLGSEDIISPYSIIWDTKTATNSGHNLTAVARDAAENTKTSTPVTVTVNNIVPDTTAPTVSITAPSNGTTYSSAQTVTVSASASDNISVTKVEFYDNGILKCTINTSPYNCDWPITSGNNGTHNINIKAYDTAGNVGMASISLTINIPTPDTTAPTVSITTPSGTVSGTTVTVSANASDNVGVVGVQFKLDGVNLGSEDTTSPYFVTWNTTIATNGTHILTATARDTAGNSKTSSSVTVTVSNSVTFNIGETNIVSSINSGNANILIAQPATLSTTATIQSLSFYIESVSGKLRLGIYSAGGPSGGPGTKKAETSEITPVVGWNTVSVITPVSLPAGTYWLAYLGNSNSLSVRRTTTSYGGKYYTFTYGTLPGTFSTTPTNTSYHRSFYATLK